MFQRFIDQIGRWSFVLTATLCLIFTGCGGDSVTPPVARDFSSGTIKAHTAPVTAVLLSPDGKQIVSAGRDGRLVIWDVTSKTAVVELLGKGDQLRSVAITADGKLVAAGND